MWIAIEQIGAEPYVLQQPHGLRAPVGRGGQPVGQHPLGDQVEHRVARVERSEGILEDDLHVPPVGLERRAAQGGDVHPVDLDLARVRPLEPQDRARQRGLAAARFPDDADRLAGLQR